MRKPNILALLPFLVKGALSIAILREMRARGFDVTVAFCDDASGTYKPDGMEDFKEARCLVDLSRSSVHEYRNIIGNEIQRREIDLVLQIGAYPLYSHLPYWKEGNPGLKIVDTLYNEVGHTRNHFFYERCMDGLIVESEHMRRFVLERTFKENPGIAVVRSGVDLTWLTPDSHKATTGTILVGYIGRMSAEKNPLGFVDLVNSIHSRVPGATFSMNGEGDQSELVRQRVKESRAAGKLTYGGYVNDIRQALRSLDVLILPSKIDGRPNIIMEANACGVPVIGAPVGGVPELIEEGRNGYLVAPTDTARIAELLTGWSNDRAALRDLQMRSRQLAVSLFSRPGMMDAYAETFCNFVRK